MMAARLARPDGVLPLFTWPEQMEIARLAEERTRLVARIGALPRHSHRRVVLDARLRELTARQLRLEAALDARRGRP